MMENIVEKLKTVNDKNDFRNWNIREIKQLLEIYYVFSKKEAQIFDLIYQYHGCDSWEDIFRDFDAQYLEDKATGVEIALDAVNTKIEEN